MSLGVACPLWSSTCFNANFRFISFAVSLFSVIQIRKPYKLSSNLNHMEKGIRGWLVLYAVMISIHALLIILILATLIADNNAFANINFYNFLIGLIVILYALYLLFTKNKKAKLWNIAAMLISIFTALLPVPSIRGQPLGNFTATLIVSIIWIIYWNKSKRVKATFS